MNLSLHKMKRYPLYVYLTIIFLLIGSLFSSRTAQAHAYSASFTQIEMDNEKAEIVFSIDTLSILELLPKIDKNKNWVLEESEVKEDKHHLEELITEGLTLDKGNEEQIPDITKMEIVKKENKIFLSTYMSFPAFSPGDTISFNDGFYANDTGTNYVDLISASYMGQASEGVLQGKDRTWTILLTEMQQEQEQQEQEQQEQEAADEGLSDETEPESGAGKTNKPVQPSSSSWLSFFKLGTLHILTGYDHLLFLFALLLRKQTFKQYAAIVTAFTIAHSITLSFAVLGWITLPSRLVEATIAFSICYVALENMFKKEIRHRWGITFLFGLIHGLGFASILKEMAIPKSHLATALISFNLGIEFVQLLIVLLLVPILTYIYKFKTSEKIIRYGSVLIAALGAIWLVQRIFL